MTSLPTLEDVLYAEREQIALLRIIALCSKTLREAELPPPHLKLQATAAKINSPKVSRPLDKCKGRETSNTSGPSTASTISHSVAGHGKQSHNEPSFRFLNGFNGMEMTIPSISAEGFTSAQTSSLTVGTIPEIVQQQVQDVERHLTTGAGISRLEHELASTASQQLRSSDVHFGSTSGIPQPPADNLTNNLSNSLIVSKNLILQGDSQNQAVDANANGTDRANSTGIDHLASCNKDTAPGGPVVDVIEILDSSSESIQLDDMEVDHGGEDNPVEQENAEEIPAENQPVNQPANDFDHDLVPKDSDAERSPSPYLEFSQFNDEEDRLYIENSVLDQELVMEVENMEELHRSQASDAAVSTSTEDRQMTLASNRKSKSAKPSLYVRGGHSRTFANPQNGKQLSKGWLRRRR